MQSKYERGLEQVRLMAGDAGYEAVKALSGRNPELARTVVEFGFGEIYADPVLDLRTKEIASIVSLVTQGGVDAQLAFHYQAARHVGVTEEELVAVLLHCIPHVGIPRVMNAFAVLEAVKAPA